MAVQYTVEEEKELNKQLKQWKNRAKRLILSDYYDSIELGSIDYSILKQVTNAETYKDVNFYLWNSGLIEKTLDNISNKLKIARKECS